MKLHVIALRDSAADAFGRPDFVPSIGAQLRGFADEVNRPDEKNMLYKHPEHFELFHLGYYDDATATFELFDKPKQIALATNLIVTNREGDPRG